MLNVALDAELDERTGHDSRLWARRVRLVCGRGCTCVARARRTLTLRATPLRARFRLLVSCSAMSFSGACGSYRGASTEHRQNYIPYPLTTQHSHAKRSQWKPSEPYANLETEHVRAAP